MPNNYFRQYFQSQKVQPKTSVASNEPQKMFILKFSSDVHGNATLTLSLRFHTTLQSFQF